MATCEKSIRWAMASTYGKTMGKHRAKPWKYGKSMGNLWEIYGKSMGNLWEFGNSMGILSGLVESGKSEAAFP